MPVNQSEIIEYGITQAMINQLVNRKVWKKINLMKSANNSPIFVATQEVDIVPMVLIPTVERTRLMDFTIPLLIGNSRLMLRYPKEESRLVAAIQPFTLLVNHGQQNDLLLPDELRHSKKKNLILCVHRLGRVC